MKAPQVFQGTSTLVTVPESSNVRLNTSGFNFLCLKIEENILFVKGSEFPKGKPEKVLTVAELKSLTSHYSYMDLTESLRKDWEVISKLVVSYNLNKNEGVLVDDTSTSGISLLSLLITITLLSAWFVWRL